MKAIRLPGWLAKLLAALGGAGLFVVTFLDSSVLSFPFVADLLVMERSHANPARMPFYAGMAALGSLAGCIWLYYLAKKGGEAYYRKRAAGSAGRIRQWVERNGFMSVAVPALLPPPMPFKVFVLAAGIFQVRLRTFIVALLVARGMRYFLEGFLAIRYGDAASNYLMAHKLGATLSVVIVLLGLYAASRVILRGEAKRQ